MITRKQTFQNYIVIGSGTIAFKIAVYLAEQGISPFVLISRDQLLSTPSLLEKHQIKWKKLSRDELTAFFLETIDNTLVISAGNRYLFPKQVVKKKNLYIINYHAALLPAFPGRNAEAWCIYEGMSEGGITWHEIDEGVDTGNILTQNRVEIQEDTTSLRLLKKYSALAEQSFQVIFPKIISGEWKVKPQAKKVSKNDLYFSWQRPSDGIFDPKAPANELDRLLRCYDYGPLNILGSLTVHYEEIPYKIVKYRLQKTEEEKPLAWSDKKNTLYFAKEGISFELKIQPANL